MRYRKGKGLKAHVEIPEGLRHPEAPIEKPKIKPKSKSSGRYFKGKGLRHPEAPVAKPKYEGKEYPISSNTYKAGE